MAGILTEIRNVAKKAKRELGGDPGIVKLNVDELVGLIGDNATKGSVAPDLQAAALDLLTHPDPGVRAEFEYFYFGEVQTPGLVQQLRDARRKVPSSNARRGPDKGWAHTKVGTPRPDATELRLGDNRIEITDFTHRYSDPVHNFKMMFYEIVMQRATGLDAVGNEFRGPLQQNPD